MSRAHEKGAELRRILRLKGRVDAEGVANMLGFDVDLRRFTLLQEMTIDDTIGVAARLGPQWRRWVIAHAIGHKVLHPGNHLWIRRNTQLGNYFEREAEEFGAGLLIDPREARQEGFR